MIEISTHHFQTSVHDVFILQFMFKDVVFMLHIFSLKIEWNDEIMK